MAAPALIPPVAPNVPELWKRQASISCGEAYLLAGWIDDALTTATRALDLCRTRSERGREAKAAQELIDVIKSYLSGRTS